MQFLNPALLAGAALFVVPLVIHLLNRQRHKKRPWAAMEFLLRAYQKQRNRLRNENLLLLLLRCLIPIVLALAIARPMLQQAAALLSSGGGVHHVVVLDGTYSMGARVGGGTSAFDKGKAMIGRLFERLEHQQEVRDKVTLVLAGTRPRFLVRQDLDLEAAKAQLLLMQRPEDAAGDLTDAMAQVADALEQEADPEVRIYVLTDLQRRSMGRDLPAGADPGNPAPKARGAGSEPPGTQQPSPGQPSPGQPGAEPKAAEATEPHFQDTLRDVCERLQKNAAVRLHWIDCGPFADQRTGGTADNVQITGLRQEMVVTIAKVPATLVVTLKNRGQTATSVPVTLDLDGTEPMRKVVRLEAGAEGEAEFQVVFRETGRRRIRASIQNDGLEADDEWFTALDVRERVRVLLVDGAADDDPLRSYYHLFGGLLDPEQGKGGPEVSLFSVTPADTLALLGGKVDPAAHDVTILADVDRLNETAAKGLVRALQAGRGVLLLLGEHANQESYNLHLYGDGDGPMPFRLRGTAGGRPGASLAPAPVIVLPEHKSLADFDEAVYREILQNIPVHRWHTLAADSLRKSPGDRRPEDRHAGDAEAPPAEVVLRIADAAQSPLLITARAAEGRFACLTSAPASEYRPERWNELHFPMAAYPLLHGLVKWLSLPATDSFQTQVGAELGCTLPARPEEVHVLRPERDGGAKVPLGEEPRPLPGGRYALPPYNQTTFAGFYVYELLLDREAGKEPVSLPFAVNVEPDEGDLQYAAAEECKQLLGLPHVLTNLPAEQGAAAAGPERSEFGPLLLLCTLLFVLGEAALARYVSVRRT